MWVGATFSHLGISASHGKGRESCCTDGRLTNENILSWQHWVSYALSSVSSRRWWWPFLPYPSAQIKLLSLKVKPTSAHDLDGKDHYYSASHTYPPRVARCSLTHWHIWSITDLIEIPVRSGDLRCWIWWSGITLLMTAISVPGSYGCSHTELCK